MLKNKFKIAISILVLLIVFILGMFAQYCKLHMYIPGGRYLADYLFVMVYNNNHYYSASGTNGEELFDLADVSYPFNFIVMGDSREIASIEKEYLITKIMDERPSFVLDTGDMVANGDEHQWRRFDEYNGQIIGAGIPIYPVLGNHEYYNAQLIYADDPTPNLKLFFARFPVLNGNKWYSFKYGNSLFVMLDTNTQFSRGTEQFEWFKSLMSTIDSRFTFLMGHHPPHSKSGNIRRKSERLIADILENYTDSGAAGVDVVFSGHVHNYERYLVNGINYIVTGGGGAQPHNVRRDSGDFYNKDGATYHYCRVRVDPNQISFQMVKWDGESKGWIVADEFVIEKR